MTDEGGGGVPRAASGSGRIKSGGGLGWSSLYLASKQVRANTCASGFTELAWWSYFGVSDAIRTARMVKSDMDTFPIQDIARRQP